MKLKTNLMQYCLGISIFLTSFSTVHGQIVNEKYKTDAIYLYGHKYVKNGIEYPITSWRKDLKKEMEVSPDAVMEYDKFLRKRSTAFIMSTIAVVSAVSFLYVNNDDIQNALLLGAIGLTVASIPIYHSAGNKLQKAIWLRNGAILN